MGQFISFWLGNWLDIRPKMLSIIIVVVFHSHTMYLIETNDIIVGRFVHITGVVKVITSRYEYKPTRH